MTRLSFFTAVIAIGMGVVSGFQAVRHPYTPIADEKDLDGPMAHEKADANSDGAFRDGLYLGKMAADRGVQSHIAIGRWATAEDRSSFTEGYQRGYNEVLASRVGPHSRGRHIE